MGNEFQVGHIDHVELIVPDRYEAAEWHQNVLGLEICHEYEMWADRGGPLVVSSDDGHTMLALFQGRPDNSGTATGYRLVAFRIDGSGFVEFVDRIGEIPLVDREGEPIESANIVDHDLAYSVYFSDPYGYRYELTTYERDVVAEALESVS